MKKYGVIVLPPKSAKESRVSGRRIRKTGRHHRRIVAKALIILIALLPMSMGLLTFMMSTVNEGVPVGPEFQVNAYIMSNQDYPAAAMNDTGNFVIAWQSSGQDGDGSGIFAQRYNSVCIPQGTEFQVNTYTVNTQTSPSVVMNSTGNFMITWESNGQDGSGYGIYAQQFDNNGNPVGLEFRVNTYNTSDQRYPSAAMDSNGNFVITWESNGQDGSGYGIYAQQFDNNGNPVGLEFQVNTYNTSDQRYPSAAMDSNGNFVITWESNGQDGSGNGIYAQQFDNNGNPVGFEFPVNTYTAGNQRIPSATMNYKGDFVITWESWFQDGDNWGVFAQPYDSIGVPQGTEFQVNSYTINFQAASSVDMDSGGNFVITWMSFGQDGDWGGIYAHHFDNMGNPLGTEFQVNTYTLSDQSNPAIAMDPAGNYVIAWQSNIQDGAGFGIFAQCYDSRVPLDISNIQVRDITDTNATVTWESLVAANSTVEFGFSSAYGFSVENNSKVILHSMNLTGLEPGRLYHFRVISYSDSENYSISGDFTFTTRFPMELELGWNMISIPLNQTDTDIQLVLENISGDYDAVQCYNTTEPIDPWKHNSTKKYQSLNDLSEIDRFKGLWIHMEKATTLYVNGTAPEIGYVNQITLHNGWNFVGYPSLIERAPGSSGLPAGVVMVQWYNASSGLWESWDPGVSPDTLDLLKPGQGLWVHYTGASDVWSLEYVN